MKYAGIFLLLAGLAAYCGVLLEGVAARLLLGWVTASFLVVAASYARARPHLLLKRLDGRRPWWAWLTLWPYYSLAWATWWIYRTVDRRAPSTEIAPGVWLSRRLTNREARASGIVWRSVLDLAAELPRTSVLGASYRSLAALDGTPPTIGQLRAGVAWINERITTGPMLVHCALGHGRSASVIIAWFLAMDEHLTVELAIKRVREARPGVGLKQAQIRCLEEFRRVSTAFPPQYAEEDK